MTDIADSRACIKRAALLQVEFDDQGEFEITGPAGPTYQHALLGLPGSLETMAHAGKIAGMFARSAGCSEKYCGNVNDGASALELAHDAEAVTKLYRSLPGLGYAIGQLFARDNNERGASFLNVVGQGGAVFKQAAKSALFFYKAGVFEFAEGVVKKLKLGKNAGSMLAAAVDVAGVTRSIAAGTDLDVIGEERTLKYIKLVAACTMVAFAAFNIFTALSTMVVSPILFPVLLTSMVVANIIRGVYEVHMRRMLSEHIFRQELRFQARLL